jgi:hypothetical protein
MLSNSSPRSLVNSDTRQVWLVERYVTDTAGAPVSAIAQLGVASHTTSQASPAAVAGYVQGQWAIEVLHWLRDTCYREDNSTVRTRSGPRVLASLRNLAIGALRLAGRRDITEATRWACRHMTRPFPSSASRHDLETAVASGMTIGRAWSGGAWLPPNRC